MNTASKDIIKRGQKINLKNLFQAGRESSGGGKGYQE